jgi:hypothetical protein
MLTFIENVMFTATAMLAASTPAAPLIAQNQGVGRGSIAFTSRIPVGKPNPRRKPSGAIRSDYGLPVATGKRS